MSSWVTLETSRGVRNSRSSATTSPMVDTAPDAGEPCNAVERIDSGANTAS